MQCGIAATRHRDFKRGTRRKRGGWGGKIEKKKEEYEEYAEKGAIEEVFTNPSQEFM